jgi:isochorismate pyruvate lyase
MAEVRAGVDQVDRELIRMLERRFGYMRAAARIKMERAAVRDEGRKAQVHGNVLSAANAAALPAGLVTTLWEQLIEASIAYELAEWDRLRS